MFIHSLLLFCWNIKHFTSTVQLNVHFFASYKREKRRDEHDVNDNDDMKQTKIVSEKN